MRNDQYSAGERADVQPGQAGVRAPAALPPSGKRIGERQLIWMMALLMALNALGIDAVLPALDNLAADLGATGNSRQFVVGAYLLAAGIGALVPGSLADRYGRRPVLFTSLGLYILFSLLCAVAWSFESLLTLRFLQGFGAAGIVALPPAIIRDRVGGDKMARMMSLIFVIFLMVPAIAPSIGQGVVMVMGDWRWIFVFTAVAGVLMGYWAWRNLPETLHPEDKQLIRPRVIVRNMRATLTMRQALGYTLGSAVIFGALFGFINSAQQLVGEAFGAGPWFPAIFAACAGAMAIASWTNSRIVERFGARRVSHTGLFLFLGVAALQLFFATQTEETLWTFVPLMAANMMLLGFIGANFGSIAMHPFQETAGAAASAQTFIRMVSAALIGAGIGYAYNGTAIPLATALFCGALICIGLVLYAERGKLFGPPVSED
ncbi:MAG: multidrug effflux MFS transporter [Erythrobacter sp.]|nr:multidrug effflux MFS transporter [Erythrobacter sp.]NCQ63933.1 multidrug effflux MFS transporter [Alphaproteobacteria bacterium]